MTARALLLVAVSLVAPARADDACRREPDGRVTCTGPGFGALVDVAQVARADAARCGVERDSCRAQLGRVQLELDSCDAEPVVELPVPPPVPPPAAQSRVLPLVGFAVGVVGALAVGAVASSTLRAGLDVSPVGLGIAGVAAVAVGAVLVAW